MSTKRGRNFTWKGFNVLSIKWKNMLHKSWMTAVARWSTKAPYSDFRHTDKLPRMAPVIIITDTQADIAKFIFSVKVFPEHSSFSNSKEWSWDAEDIEASFNMECHLSNKYPIYRGSPISCCPWAAYHPRFKDMFWLWENAKSRILVPPHADTPSL